MSKILCVGDQHFRLELAYASAISDGRNKEWKEVLKVIHEASKSCDAVILMGDNFNGRNNPSIVIRDFVEFLKGFGDKPIYILCGNHERYGTHTALDFLQKFDHPNWHVYTNITTGVKIGDIIATFIPYTTPAMLGVLTKEEGEKVILNLPPADVAFVHHAISGTKNTEFFSEIMLDKDKLSSLFGMTFGGHVHKPERLSNTVIVTGNILTQEVGEHRKVAWEWDSVTNTALEIPLPVRGIYKIVWEERDVKEVMPSYSIVKCYVTNRETNIDDVKEFLKPFDASMIVEQYPSERSKVHFESGALDLSIEGLLKLYAGAKKVDYNDLAGGFELIK